MDNVIQELYSAINLLKGDNGEKRSDLQKIYFGAPGTGKSRKLKNEADEKFQNRQKRVTFHPSYSYAHFVGVYKPVSTWDQLSKRNVIDYKYVPGPFMDIYVRAIVHPDEDFALIIEEINRANVASVFGDVFQLLDRDSDGTSLYPVDASEDIKNFLTKEIVAILEKENRNTEISNYCDIIDSANSIYVLKEEYTKLKLPNNMFIWASMNSADQGVLPLDTAFKRRWAFRYIRLNEGKDALIKDYKLSDLYIPTKGSFVPDGNGDYQSNDEEIHFMKWNDFREHANNALKNLSVNEDKCMGPFFIDKDSLLEMHQLLTDLGASDSVKSVKVSDPQQKKAINDYREYFSNKVLMYLFEDAAKAGRNKLFDAKECTSGSSSQVYLSDVCDAFVTNGENIFSQSYWKP